MLIRTSSLWFRLWHWSKFGQSVPESSPSLIKEAIQSCTVLAFWREILIILPLRTLAWALVLVAITLAIGALWIIYGLCRLTKAALGFRTRSFFIEHQAIENDTGLQRFLRTCLETIVSIAILDRWHELFTEHAGRIYGLTIFHRRLFPYQALLALGAYAWIIRPVIQSESFRSWVTIGILTTALSFLIVGGILIVIAILKKRGMEIRYDFTGWRSIWTSWNTPVTLEDDAKILQPYDDDVTEPLTLVDEVATGQSAAL